MKRSWFPLPVTLAVAAAVLAVNTAIASPDVAVTPTEGGARLTVGGKLITLFRTPNGKLNPEQRAETAANRLRELIAGGLAPAQIQIRSSGARWGVYAAGGLIMVATEDEAALRKETPEATARKWATNLKQALAGSKSTPATVVKKPVVSVIKPSTPIPPSTAAEPKVDDVAIKPPARPLAQPALPSSTVPVGERRLIALKGTATGAVTVRSDNPDVATAHPVAGKGAVEVRGLSPGKAVLRVQRGATASTLTVWVKAYAGRVVESPVALVTGTLAPGTFVRRVARKKLLEGVRTEPGAIVQIAGEMQGLQALARGAETTIRAPILITGANYLPVRSEARVTVRNVALPPTETDVLLYSNDPESVREYGILHEGVVRPEGAARLFYHHQNRMGRAFTFQLNLLNPGNQPVEVQIIPAEAGPILDTIQVGHGAGKRYMEALMADVGYIVSIPPRSARVIYSVSVGQMLTVSGIYNLRILKGGPLVANVTAEAKLTTPAITQHVIEEAEGEPDTYPNPQKSETHRYVVGQQWLFIPVGRQPLTARIPTRKLNGNYGVLYELKIEMENPTDVEVPVRLMFTPTGDWARGVFVVDGQLIEAKQSAPPVEIPLWVGRLAPNERRTMRVRALPLGGSSYPVTLVVRP